MYPYISNETKSAKIQTNILCMHMRIISLDFKNARSLLLVNFHIIMLSNCFPNNITNTCIYDIFFTSKHKIQKLLMNSIVIWFQTYKLYLRLNETRDCVSITFHSFIERKRRVLSEPFCYEYFSTCQTFYILVT